MKTFTQVVGIILFFISTSYGQRYWVGTTSADWNNAANWSMAPGGTGGASVPGAGDQVLFDRVTPNACILISATSISQFTMSGGALSFTSSASLTISSTFNMSGGTLSLGAGALTVTSNTFTLSGGSLDAGSSTITIGNNMTVPTPASFLPGTSTVVFNGTNQQDVVIISGNAPGLLTFYNLTIDKADNHIINFSSPTSDTFQINNLLSLVEGRFDGNGFIKVQKDLTTYPNFGGSGIPIACTGPDPSLVTLNSPLAVTGVSPFVGIAKSSPTTTVDVVRGPLAADDTIRAGNFNARFILRQGILEFSGNNPVIGYFQSVEIDPGATFIAPRNYFYNSGAHLNLGGVFDPNGGTYVFHYANIPAVTQITNHVENFYNLIIDIGGGQFNPSANDTLVVNNTLTLRGGAITGNSASALNAKGNVVMESAFSPTQNNTSLIFSGTGDQQLSFAPGTEGNWNASVVVNKPSGSLILQSPVILDPFCCSMTFTRGIVKTTATNYIQFKNGYAATGASNSSYVDGPVQYQWYSDFIFPIGNGGYYAPAQVTSSGNELTTAQYFHADPTPLYNTSLHDAAIANVSTREYWMISKTGTSSSPYVWLSYDNARSGGVTSPAALLVAHWNGSLWNNLGNGAVNAGFVRTLAMVSSFSPFTLASTDAQANPLPLHFVGFTAKRVAEGALLNWQTSDEINNDYFNIQRAADATGFINIGKLNAQTGGGGNYSYSFTDKNLPDGKSFYRLQQVDLDGHSSYSKIVSLSKSDPVGSPLSIFPNPAKVSATIQCPVLADKEASLEIIDAGGRRIKTTAIHFNSAGNWNLTDLPVSGLYVVVIRSGDAEYQQKLLIR